MSSTPNMDAAFSAIGENLGKALNNLGVGLAEATTINTIPNMAPKGGRGLE